jgi:hypothetical protein
MKWVAAAPDTPHSRAAALAAGAIALVALLVLPERPAWLLLCLLLSAVLAAVEAISDPPQWFAASGYATAAALTALTSPRPWWTNYPKAARYGLATLVVFVMGSVYATRVALDSNWELSGALYVVALALLAIVVVGVALSLALRRANPWPLLLVTILLTAWTFLSLPSIGGVFVLPAIALWVITIRSLRRARAPSGPGHRARD